MTQPKGIRNLLLLAYASTLMPLLKQNLIKLQEKIYWSPMEVKKKKKKRYGSQRKSADCEHNTIATDKQKNYPCLSLLQFTGIFIKIGLLWIPFHPFSPLTSRLTLPNSSFSRMSYISTCLCPGGLKAKYSLTRVIPWVNMFLRLFGIWSQRKEEKGEGGMKAKEIERLEIFTLVIIDC